VPTLEALCCALARFRSVPGEIVLVAHDKHYDRAFYDLRARYVGRIINPGIAYVPYRTDSRWLPFAWAVREIYLARPRDFIMRAMGRCTCQPNVMLPPLP
jgi:hypothetical protein